MSREKNRENKNIRFGLVLVLSVTLLIFIGVGCIDKEQTQASSESYNKTELLSKAAEKFALTSSHEFAGGLRYTEGMKFFENKQFIDASNSFNVSSLEFVYAEGSSLEETLIWRELYSKETNEDLKTWYTYRYWVSDAKAKLYESYYKRMEYLSVAMEYFAKNNVELAQKKIDLANKELDTINSSIDNLNKYNDKLRKFEEENGMRPPSI